MTQTNLALMSSVILVACLQVYWAARDYINPAPLLSAQVKALKTQLDRMHLSQMVQEQQFENFRQNVAAALPSDVNNPKAKAKDYPLRNLASITQRAYNEKVESLVADTLFESGRSLFRKREYARANRLFERLIQHYGFSTQVVEAYFLLAEGQYQLGELEAASQSIGRMMELFPESELTGFALLRLGGIFEQRDRYDDAIQIYRTVLKAFPYRSVASQAERNLRDMEP